jgi:hypothetical protein
VKSKCKLSQKSPQIKEEQPQIKDPENKEYGTRTTRRQCSKFFSPHSAGAYSTWNLLDERELIYESNVGDEVKNSNDSPRYCEHSSIEGNGCAEKRIKTKVNGSRAKFNQIHPSCPVSLSLSKEAKLKQQLAAKSI